MAKPNRVSYKGKYQQRSYSSEQPSLEALIGLDEDKQGHPAGKRVRKSYYTFSQRPDEDGNIPRDDKSARKRPSTSSRNSKRPTIQEDHVICNPVELAEDPKDTLNELIDDLINNQGFQPSVWASRQMDIDEDWKQFRPFIMDKVLSSEVIEEEMPPCFACCDETSIVRCLDCTGSFLCQRCDRLIHTCNPLHDRLIYTDGYFEPLAQEYNFPLNRFTTFTCRPCGSSEWITKEKGSFIVVTMKGRFDVPRTFRICLKCSCREPVQSELASLIRRGFWPANPDLEKSSYLFDVMVLEMWRNIYRHLPGASLCGFIASLNDTSTKYDRKSTINQTTFSRVIAEYGYMVSEVDLLKHQDPMKCPPCSIQQLSAHIDGNHKLYRYAHVPRGNRQPYHKNRFIVDDSCVSEHLSQVYTDVDKVNKSHQDIYCGGSRWKAAREVASRYKNMDETGIVVAGCRHAICQKAVNMQRGELYGYSHYLHITFLMQNGVHYMFQDVICKYWPWANKIGNRIGITSNLWKSAVTSIKPALSVLHAKAHAWHCQICWGGRYVDGVGAGSGEDMEQAFSHLSRLGLTTKHMSVAARSDTITEHVLFWNGRKIQSLPELLCKRFKRTQEALTSTRRDIAFLCDKSQVPEDVLHQWTEEVVKAAKDVHFGTDKSTSSILQSYFISYEKVKSVDAISKFLDSTSEGLCAVLGLHKLFQAAKTHSEDVGKVNLDDLKKQLPEHLLTRPEQLYAMAKKETVKYAAKRLQTDIEMTHNAIRHRADLILSLADTSKQRSAYVRKNEQDKKRIVVALDKLYQIEKLNDVNASKADIAKVTTGHFPWQITGEADWGEKRKAADLCQLKQRLMEEERHLITEMRNFLNFYIKVQSDLQDEIRGHEEILRKFSTEMDRDSVHDDNTEEEDIERDLDDHSDNEMSETTTISSSWKSPNVIILHKKPKTSKNYRPISLLSHTYKLYTKILTNKLVKKLDENQATEQEQQRYCVHASSKTAVSIKGLIAIKRQGLDEARRQIGRGLTFFQKATSTEGWRDLVFEAENELEGDEEDCDDEEEDILSLVAAP